MHRERSNLKVRQGRETAEKLLEIARQAFADNGYTATRTEDIIATAKLTKGALYHHFSSKLLLFEEVYRSVENLVAQRIEAACAEVDDPWERFVQGCFAYLDACQDPGFQRILRVDAPSVLGLDRWAQIDREYGVDRLIPALHELSEARIIDVTSVESFAWQITGAMNEATFWISQHAEPAYALQESKKMLLQLMQGARSGRRE